MIHSTLHHVAPGAAMAAYCFLATSVATLLVGATIFLVRVRRSHP